MSPEQGKNANKIKSLFKECLTKVASFLYSCKASKESTSDMGDVLVHFIHRAQVGLDFDKAVRIFLKGDKDQASIKLPCLFIDAIRIGI